MTDCTHMTVRFVITNRTSDLRRGECCGCDLKVGAFRAYEEGGVLGQWGPWREIQPGWVSFFHKEES